MLVPMGVLAWLPWIAAAGFALLAGFLWQAFFAAKGELVGLHEQAELAVVEAKSLQQQLEAERILAARRLADTAIEGRASAAMTESEFVVMLPPPADFSTVAVARWNPREQEGTLVVQGLHVLPNDKTYQLWISDSTTPPWSAGIFDAAATGETRFTFKSARPTRKGVRFSLTIAPRGGGLTLTDPVVLSSQ